MSDGDRKRQRGADGLRGTGPGALPDLKQYMDKTVLVRLQHGRAIKGTLRGYDAFLNLVLDNTVGATTSGEPTKEVLGNDTVIRGNFIVNIEQLQL